MLTLKLMAGEVIIHGVIVNILLIILLFDFKYFI